MDLITFKQQLIDAANNNTLLIAKHDPNNLNTTWPTYRSVLSHEASASLESFIKSGDLNDKGQLS